MSDKRQKIQFQLAFMMEGKDESPRAIIGGAEAPVAESKAESPAEADKLMEEILDPENLRGALKRVKANKGSAGIDRMTVELMPEYLKKHWPEIREQVLSGTRRIETPWKTYSPN